MMLLLCLERLLAKVAATAVCQSIYFHLLIVFVYFVKKRKLCLKEENNFISFGR